MRFRHLKLLGHDAFGINMEHVCKHSAVEATFARLAWKLGWPLDLEHLNTRVSAVMASQKPDLIWVDKGIRVSACTLNNLKVEHPDCRLVHYNPDDPFGHGGRGGWRRFIKTIPLYDVHFVPRKVNIEEYRAHGAKQVYFNVPTRGYDPAVHRPYSRSDAVVSAFLTDIGFLGGFERERAESLLALGQAGLDVLLMHDWPERCWHPRFQRAPFDVRGVQYAKALSAFKIGLGFLRKVNRDQHTSRSIEITACGTFLLAERTDEHQSLFEEGKEAEFFSSNDELVDKARFYLEHDSLREKIAAAGRARCINGGYDYGSRMALMLKQAIEV